MTTLHVEYLQRGTPTKHKDLCKPLSTAPARSTQVGSGPVEPTAITPHIASAITMFAKLAQDIRSGHHIWDGTFVSWTTLSRALQPHALLLLELERVLQPMLHCASTVGGRPIGNASDGIFHKRNRFRVFKVRNQELVLCLHDLVLAERTHQQDVDRWVGIRWCPYLVVTGENSSSTTLSKVNFPLKSTRALSQRG